MLTAGNYETVGLPTIGIPFGDHTLSIWTELPNGIEDSYTVNDTTILNFTNEPGTTVDININFDPLPYGFEWYLTNVDTEEIIDFGGPYQNDEYGCDTITISYCLPEGNYELILEDLFGNGMFYPCPPTFEPGSIYTTSGNDTLTSAIGNWGDEEILPFYVGPPVEVCPPLGDCPWDLDGDGIVGTSDLFPLLQNFGLSVECSPLDFNQDSIVGVDDILEFISVFGLQCDNGMMLETEIPESIKQIIISKGIQIPENQNTVENIEYYNIYGAKINLSEITSSGIYIKKIKYSDGTYQIKKEFFN